MARETAAVELDERKVDAAFRDIDQCHLPGAAIGIAIGGRPVYRKGFGLASIELPVVLSPGMRMRIYSTSKHFTCLAYLLLCEQGKAGIDDPLGKFLPELHPIAHRVTMRQLMGHLGGLYDAHDLCWEFSGTGRAVSSAELLSFYRDIDCVQFEPGTAWSYSNGGFLLLSTVIERIAGQSLEEVLRGSIFTPVGMHDTLLRRFDTDFVPNSATLHMLSDSGAFDRSDLGTASTGEGGIVSTVDDMLRWVTHMDDPWVGTAVTWAQMKTPQILANGTSTGYGLGLRISRYRGLDVIYHAGGGFGGSSQMMKLPHLGLDIVIMVNRHDVSSMELTDRILDACVPGVRPRAKPLDSPLASGTFRSPRTGFVMQLLPGKGRQIVMVGGSEMPFVPDERGVLWPENGRVKLGITLKGDPIAPSWIHVTDFGNEDELRRLPPLEEPDVNRILGHYRHDSSATRVTISQDHEGAPQLHAVGRFGSMSYGLECLAEGIWRTKLIGPRSWMGGIVSFDSDGRGLRYSNAMTWSLPFRRCD